MSFLIEVLNHPADAFRNKSKAGAWILAAVAILINTVFEPLLTWYVSSGHHIPDFFPMLRKTLYGCASYLSICAVLWVVCRCFGSSTPFINYLQTWGLTFIPNILCSFAVAFSETYFTVFWNNSIWGMLLSIVFFGILIWKTMLYIVFLREVAELKGGRMMGAFAAAGVGIILLAILNGYAGLKTPVL